VAPLSRSSCGGEPSRRRFREGDRFWTETPDREPAIPILRRSAKPIGGDCCGETLRRGVASSSLGGSRGRLHQWSPGSLTVSASRYRRGRCFPHATPAASSAFGPFPDRSGTGSVRSLGRCRLSARTSGDHPLGVPVWDGRPEPPGIRPGRDGPAAEPREEVSRRRPPAETGGRSLRSRPSRATGPVSRAGTNPRSRFGLQALACGEVSGRAAFAGPEGRRELRRILRSPATLPGEGSACLRLLEAPTRGSTSCRLLLRTTRAGTLAACGG
jgi:hypothetical protein